MLKNIVNNIKEQINSEMVRDRIATDLNLNVKNNKC